MVANDPRDLDGTRLINALRMMGRNERVRDRFMRWLASVEEDLEFEGDVRDVITGPIMDALHTENDEFEKTLADGTKIRFLYRTKIARDFLLSDRERPTHVWEPQTTRLLQYLAANTKDDVLIGGAYFGDQAILVAKQIAGTGRVVHCFEPSTDQSAMLRTNIEINALNNIVVFQLGLWDTSSLRMKLDGFDSFANVVSALGDEGFKTITIDDFASEQDAHLGVIMIDIEGAELKALTGAQATLERDKPVVVFEVNSLYVDWSNGLVNTPIGRLLSDFGYNLYGVRDFNSHQDMSGLPIELVPAETAYLGGPPHGFNMVAVTHPSIFDNPEFKIVQGVSPKLLRHRDPALHHPTDGLPD